MSWISMNIYVKMEELYLGALISNKTKLFKVGCGRILGPTTAACFDSIGM